MSCGRIDGAFPEFHRVLAILLRNVDKDLLPDSIIQDTLSRGLVMGAMERR